MRVEDKDGSRVIRGPWLWLAVTVVIVLSWPVLIATALLNVVVSRPYDASRGALLATWLTTLGAIAFAVIARVRRPRTMYHWALRGAVAGALLGPVWLASGSYYARGESVLHFAESLVGGLFYASPFGVVVGIAVGAVVGSIECRTRRVSATAPSRRRRAILLVVSVVVLQLAAACMLGRVLELNWWARWVTH